VVLSASTTSSILTRVTALSATPAACASPAKKASGEKALFDIRKVVVAFTALVTLTAVGKSHVEEQLLAN